ncbi:MAG: sialidase family protein, partial [Arenimonas sp.]
MKLLQATFKLLAFMALVTAAMYFSRPTSPIQPRLLSTLNSSSTTPPAQGVDGWVYDQYPNFVPLPQETAPRKGSIPPQYRVSPVSPFTLGCEGASQTGTNYINAEVEPSVAVNPMDQNNLIGAWQQDRWSNGAARGLSSGISFDGGRTWAQSLIPFSRCSGGTTFNGGNYERATDPWVTLSPNGTAYVMALALNRTTGSQNAMLASRSTDGGLSWSNPATLILDIDGNAFFNDKNTITADSTDSNYVYAVWDRLATNGNGPAYFARTINGGLSWEAAKSIYNPGDTGQTIGNVIAVLPDGTLINVFTKIVTVSGFDVTTLELIRSTNKGITWSQPYLISDLLAVGASDPETGTAIRDGSILAQIAAGPDGRIYVAWQDSRFSGGVRDGIAFSQSNDGGFTWSNPVRINKDANVQAMTPTVHVRPDGMIGVSYFDLRSNTTDPSTLLGDYWLAISSDGVSWKESRVTNTFDYTTAPFAGGYFVGDYQSLVS